MNPLLTIIIPTWNRLACLRALLAVVRPVLDDDPEVELLVSHNASPDDTAAFLDALPPHPRMRIVHQAVNYGAIIHAAWLFGQARGRFLWMICDDDLVTPEGLRFVLDRLRRQPDLGWIHLPHAYEVPGAAPALTRQPETDIRSAQGRELVAPYITWISFVTANVVRTELLQRQLPRIQWGTDFWPMGLLIDAVADAPAFVPAGRWITAGAEITWADRRSWAVHWGYPEEILKSRTLTRAEKRACLRQRYTDAPNHLGRLAVISPAQFCRVLRMEPRLLFFLLHPKRWMPLFRPATWRKTAQRVVHGRKALGDLFP